MDVKRQWDKVRRKDQEEKHTVEEGLQIKCQINILTKTMVRPPSWLCLVIHSHHISAYAALTFVLLSGTYHTFFEHFLYNAYKSLACTLGESISCCTDVYYDNRKQLNCVVIKEQEVQSDPTSQAHRSYCPIC